AALNSTDGKVGEPGVEDGNKLVTAGDVAAAINNSGWKAKSGGNKADGDEAESELVKAGGEVEFAAGKNLKVKRTGKVFTFETQDDVSFNNITLDGNLTAGDSVFNSDGITVSNGAAGNPVKLGKGGLDNGGNKIANVAAGDINAASTDAVNGGQLHGIIEKGFKIADGQGSEDTVKLGETVTYRSAGGNIVTTVGDNSIDFDLADKVTVGKTAASPVTIDGTTGTVGGLTNKTWNPDNIVSGQAATEDQLKQVSAVANAGWNLTAQGANSSNVAASETVDLNNTDGNIVVSKEAGKDEVTFNLAKDITVGSLTAGDTKVEDKGITVSNGTAGKPVTLTKDGLDNGGNKVVNVAAGDINAASTDAVNGSQLFNNARSIADSLGGGSAVKSDGTVGAPTYNVANPADGSSKAVNNVGDAVTALNDAVNSPLTFAGDSGTEFTRKLGSKINVKGGADEAKLSDGNIGVVGNGTDTLDVKLSKELKELASAEFKDGAGNTTVTNGTGTVITPANGNPVSLTKDGLDNGGNKVANVGKGEADSDAVNVGQLKEAQAAATAKVEGGRGVSVTPSKNPDGSKTYTVAAKTDGTTIKVDGSGNLTANTAALNSTDGKVGEPGVEDGNKLVTAGDVAAAINNAGFTAKANGDAGELVTPGDEVNFKDSNNIKVTRSGSDFTIATADNVKFDSVTASTVQLGSDGPKITGNGGNLNVEGNGGSPVKITGVKAGEADTDAVNVNQLNKAAAAVKTEVAEGKNMTVTEHKGANGQTVYTVATKDDLAVTSINAGSTVLDTNGVSIAVPTQANPQNTVSLSPIGLNNGGNTITNVAPGKNGTDAVNVNQLVGMGNQLQQNIDNVGKKAYAGVAGSIAQSSIPQVTRPGATGIGIGSGYYGGESAMAIGISSMSDGGNWIIKGNFSTNTGGHMGVGIGGLYQW
ncbi:YadA family autotransporter adhesin, partial [Neisseria weixii]